MYRRLREFKQREITDEFFRRYDAHSVGIGRKIVRGERTDQLALRVYVSRKLPIPRISSVDKVPDALPFFSRVTNEEVALVTDVIEAPPPQFEQDPTDRLRPAPGGASVDAISGTAGTLGGWVWDQTDDTIVALSNHHIFGHTVGSDAVQPGPADGGSSPGDKIGDTKRGVQRFTNVTNTVDCAIADADTDDIYDLRVLDIGPAVYAIDVPILDMLVEKSGRTTGHTFGIIDDADYETTVSGFPFDDCLRIEVVDPSPDWSAGGDSGSLVFSQTPIGEGSDIKPAVGLHFAGPSAGTYGVACKIQNVFAALNVTTICSGAFEAMTESLFEEEEQQFEPFERARPRPPVRTGRPPFAAPVRKLRRAGRPQFGISRDVQKRLLTSDRGRAINDVVHKHRATLMDLVVKDGDVRRAAMAALRPLAKGAMTTDELLSRALKVEDVDRLEALARMVTAKGGRALSVALEPLTPLLDDARGKRLADILEIRL